MTLSEKLVIQQRWQTSSKCVHLRGTDGHAEISEWVLLETSLSGNESRVFKPLSSHAHCMNFIVSDKDWKFVFLLNVALW